MNIRKTRQEQRGVYTYSYQTRKANGEYKMETVVLRPGENGVTEIDIKKLHELDDSEVYYNIKNLRPKRTEEDKKKIEEFKQNYIKAFKLEHGYEPHSEDVKDVIKEKFPSNYNLSLDFAFDNDLKEDKSNILKATAVHHDYEDTVWSERMEVVRELMTEKQREVINLMYVEGLTQSEIAEKLGVSSAAIKKRLDGAKQIIKNNFKKNLRQG